MILKLNIFFLILLLLLMPVSGFTSNLKKAADEFQPTILFNGCSKNPSQFMKDLYLETYFESLKYTLRLIQLTASGESNQIINSINLNGIKTPLLHQFLNNQLVQDELKQCLNTKYAFSKKMLIAHDYSGKTMGLILSFFTLRGIGKIASSLISKGYQPLVKILPALGNPRFLKTLKILGFSAFFIHVVKTTVSSLDELEDKLKEDEAHQNENEEKSIEIANETIRNFQQIINHLSSEDTKKSLTFKNAIAELKELVENKEDREIKDVEIKSVCLAIYSESECEDKSFINQLTEFSQKI